MISHLKESYPVRLLCQLLACPHSTYYYRSPTRDEGALLAALEQILMRWPFYGYRRLLAQLGREGFTVGERVVRRLLKELGGSRQVGRVRIQTTDSRHAHWRYPNLIKHKAITYPDEVWIADITYIRLGTRFIYLAVILDAYTRSVRGWALSRTIDQHLTLTALRMALANGRPMIFHSDQGVQYAAWEHTELLRNAGCQISMAEVGQPTQNALVERFIRTFKEEHLDYAEYAHFDDAERQIRHWLEVTYMTERIHSALGYLTPAEFEAAAIANASLLSSA
jgi:transposase InsO family protein